jgi:hypothetical protein
VKFKPVIYIHTHTHTHREREREIELRGLSGASRRECWVVGWLDFLFDLVVCINNCFSNTAFSLDLLSELR